MLASGLLTSCATIAARSSCAASNWTRVSRCKAYSRAMTQILGLDRSAQPHTTRGPRRSHGGPAFRWQGTYHQPNGNSRRGGQVQQFNAGSRRTRNDPVDAPLRDPPQRLLAIGGALPNMAGRIEHRLIVLAGQGVVIDHQQAPRSGHVLPSRTAPLRCWPSLQFACSTPSPSLSPATHSTDVRARMIMRELQTTAFSLLNSTSIGTGLVSISIPAGRKLACSLSEKRKLVIWLIAVNSRIGVSLISR